MLTRRLALIAGFALLTATGAIAQASLNTPVPPIPANIARAVASPERTKAMTDRDGGRKPAQVLALAGIKEGDKIIEIGSFGQYDTTMLVSAVGPAGRIFMYDLPYQEARQSAPSLAFVAAHPNSEYKIGKFDELTYPTGVDMVVIDMYYHDLAIPSNGVDMTVFNRKMFEALKPGGRLLIVDHLAEAGSGRRDTPTLHRIDKALILSEVAAAGFKLITDSDLFANKADNYAVRVFDPTERGGTDRAVLVFQKPL